MKRLSGLILILAVLASPLVFALPVREWLDRGEAVREGLAALGLAGPLVFLAATTLGTAAGLPRLAFCTLGGWVFGFAWGFVWSQLGSLLGAYLLFLLARHSTPEKLLKKYPKLRALSVPAGRGWWSVLLVRQLPIAGLYNDILLGWSPVTHRDFWIGSFLGFLPLGVTATLAGAGAIHADPARLGSYLAAATVLFLLLHYSLKLTTARKAG
jgi:uncharacterized membrane protein YdjX (TVP38/TMEM64 family)